MSDTLRDRIAAAVSLHEVYAVTEQDEMNAVLPPSRWKCECGGEGPLPPFEKRKAEEAVWQTNAEHIADAILAIPGIAVVELPEPAEAVRCWPALVGGEPESVYLAQGEVIVSGGLRLYADEARDLAAALLAAADYAERDQ
ncbi:MAG TPA: hypothetical protein P5534_17545 [Candidatus Paceibacterota bacterium]|nr:hypothetical protein [Mycolicibacterium fallax]HRZ38154.1 hypothetical protein [Candidatus Paceibacterota bacterium]